VADRIDTIRAVCVGFLTSEYTDERTNTHTFSSVEDFEKVRLGYACAACLAEFTTYVPVCPLCGNERDVLADLAETPADVQAYWDEATGPSPGKTVPRPMHEVIEEIVAGGADMDHIPIKGLKPSRWGAK
jgi:hypothetical protein